MSTRSVIARPLEGPVGTFEGRYHHSDGYPEGVGKTLWELAHGQFAGDLQGLVKVLIDDHPAGWSSIFADHDFPHPADFTEPIGFRNYGVEGKGPRCYCHGERNEEPSDLIRHDGDDWGTEWAYVIDPTTETLTVFERVGWALAPYFAKGDRSWAIAGRFPLSGPEPEWEKVRAAQPVS